MDDRQLTGKWYLKKSKLRKKYSVMVQTLNTSTCPYTFTTSPPFERWEKAKPEDLIELKLPVS